MVELRTCSALACDYDGTIAHDGVVSDPVVRALTRLRRSGRRLILVTGRHLTDLLHVFPRADLFDRLVVENGGTLYDPSTGRDEILGAPPPREMVDALRQQGVEPLVVGRVIVATEEPHGAVGRETIRARGDPRDVILNKGAGMILPRGVDRGSGLRAALRSLSLSPDRVVGVGDAENDLPLLDASAYAVAVANALAAVKARADLIVDAENGAGVVDLIERILENERRG